MFDIAREIRKGNPRAVAKGISLVENDFSKARKLMKEIYVSTGKSVVIGITGAPGSGKSTLVDQMIGCLRKEGKGIGIVAVDPSSPFTGGAILGDRIRMMRHSTDPDVFIRSMATRGHLGGLARATGEAIAILEAAGKDFILVETVGVGQDEVEVVKLADIVCVVLIPGVGDEVQVFKSGIMEIADVFVLNKADSSETGKTERQLKAVLDLGIKDNSKPHVVKTVATEGKGIEPLIKEIHRISAARDKTVWIARRKKLISWMFRDILLERIHQTLIERVGEKEFESHVDKIFRREMDPYTAAERLLLKYRRSRD